MTSADPSPRWRAVFHAALATLVLLLALARFLPTTFNPPGAWQDEGWVVGINMALRGGLAFGRDFIFTYGPYGGISTRLLDPASLHMVLGGGALLSIAFTAGLAGLALDRPPLLLLLTLLLPLITYLDALAYALPLPALLLAGAAGRDQPLPARTRIAILCLLPALGLLPLIKGSILAVSLIAIDAGVRCYVDDIGGSAVPPAPVPVSWPVRVNGWAVFDGPRHIGNESIALGFQARDGTLYAAQAAPIWRTDVAPIFQLPTAEGIGFTVEADTGRLPPGTYNVLVLPRRGSVTRACQTTLKLAVSAPP
jgi:hypothetical protein